MNQLIAQEDFTSVQEVQAGTTRLFAKAAKRGKFYRVMRNKSPLGVLIPNNLWLSFVEDLEMLSRVDWSKKAVWSNKTKKYIPLETLKKKWGLGHRREIYR